MLLSLVRKEIEASINKLEIQDQVNFSAINFSVSFTEHATFGHVSSNIAMVLAKPLARNPKDLAQELVDAIDKFHFSDVSVAGPGFINFTFTDSILEKVFTKDIQEIVKDIQESNELNNKKILVEYTDPNPFKVFHIGHLMTNIIGESIAGIHELAGAEVKRINYQGDVGRHIAITIWGILQPENKVKFDALVADVAMPIKQKVEWLGQMYAYGYNAFIDDEENKTKDGVVVNAVSAINKQIYDKTDEEINNIYVIGREWSLEYFETLYAMLGTKFDAYIFESEAAPIGLKTVDQNLAPHGTGVFERGEGGAVIYNADSDTEAKLHTRVFVNAQGLPTYETKDLGNMQLKLEAFPHIDKSIVITAHEQSDYFKVLYRVMSILHPELADKLVHYGHGMMRFADGKMSSRKGNIIAGDELIEMAKSRLEEKFAESRIVEEEERQKVIEDVAIAAIKYSVLKQAIGKDIIFDIDKAVSTEGDSGPYLQYTYARFSAVASLQDNSVRTSIVISESNRSLLLVLAQYEDVLLEVVRDIAPQRLITYLIELARCANSWYGSEKIQGDPANESIACKVKETLAHGLAILAIRTPERM